MLSTAVLVPILLATTFQPQISQRFTSEDGHTKLATGTLSSPLPGDLSQAATKFALQRRGELGLPVTSSLSAPETFGTRYGASFHLRQLVDGIEVENGRVVVTVDRNRRVVQLGSSVVAYKRAVIDWRLSHDEALKVASRATEWAMRDPSGRPYGGTKRMMFARGEEVRSGYLVYVPSLDLRTNWYYAVDASTGEILWRQNRAHNAADDADVYESSPWDGGVGVSAVKRVTLSHFASPRVDGGFLEGDQITMYNCCPNENCDPNGAPKRSAGTTEIFGMMVQFDVAICHRLQRATNDVSFNVAGDYVFTPVDPPASTTVSQAEPADSDPFVETHSFYHVNNVYDFVRGLSTAADPLFPDENIAPFQMRDEKIGRKPAVWTNVTMPNQQEAAGNYFATGVAKADTLMRVDNAAFMAKENFEQLFLPGLVLDVDALMIFQGNAADFGYDAPILWHEFGHGVIYSTAAFNSFTLDARSGNNEGGALHEGIADYIAAAYGNNPRVGEYVGPSLAAQTGINGPIRVIDNQDACPEVLWGEVHQDSLHFSGALWAARTEIGNTTARRDAFDAAFYAALVSMTPATDFEQAAAAISNHLKVAFGTTEEARMDALFDERGVTNCSKVLDVTGSTEARRYYGIGGWQQAGFSAAQVIPGPYQMKIHVPNGAKSVTVTAAFQGGFFGPSMPTARLLAKSDAPITFTRSATELTTDADKVANFTAAGQQQSATAAVDVPCGGDLYFTVGSSAEGGEALQNLSFTFQPADSCPMEEDAGTTVPDAGSGGGTVNVPSVPGGGAQAGGTAPAGCGCTSASPMLLAGALLALVGFIRRRR